MGHYASEMHLDSQPLPKKRDERWMIVPSMDVYRAFEVEAQLNAFSMTYISFMLEDRFDKHEDAVKELLHRLRVKALGAQEAFEHAKTLMMQMERKYEK